MGIDVTALRADGLASIAKRRMTYGHARLNVGIVPEQCRSWC
jgi:hypothetical protein